jgi:orotidine-5'-phosphate decarboxylase
MNNSERLIVALDMPTTEQVMKAVDTLGDTVGYYKIGMESFYGMGHTVLAQMASRNKRIFLDLKLHDIPNTVARSIKALCQFSPAMTTLHAAGGPKMLKAAVEAADEWSAQSNRPRPKLVAITVLTSLGEQEWAAMGHQKNIRESALRLSMMCREAGIDGVVASPQEAASIRALCGNDFLIVTPGIRPLNQEHGDQTRTATPAEALKAGSDYLVVGRPILAAPDPQAAAKAILQEMDS